LPVDVIHNVNEAAHFTVHPGGHDGLQKEMGKNTLIVQLH
jgi:hypothetical protein